MWLRKLFNSPSMHRSCKLKLCVEAACFKYGSSKNVLVICHHVKMVAVVLLIFTEYDTFADV
uniref:Uncharacterized protein n=1 Tax=Ciona intestinalis TaxID=7719 RepID=H2XRI4_CIOIN